MNNLYLPARAVIAGIERETPDVLTYRLQAASQEETAGFAPGRFLMVGLPGTEEAPISLSSIGDKGRFGLSIRTAGRVTTALTRLSAGDHIRWRGPYGRGWPCRETRGNELLLVAGGVGLAPLKPVIEAAVERPGFWGRVRLVNGGREPSSLLFRDRYEEWRKSISVLLTVDEVPPGSAWQHDVGLVTGLIDRLEPNPARTFAFICGPEIMMRFVVRQLREKGLPDNRIFVSLERRMRCGIAQCGHCQHGPFFVCRDGPVFSCREMIGLPDTLL